MVIDCHGHYTSEPTALLEYRKLQVAALNDPSKTPEQLRISDDEIREKLEPAQLKFQRERGTDIAIFAHRGGARGKNRDIRPAFPLKLQLRRLQFFANLIVADVQWSRTLGRIMQSGDLLLAKFEQSSGFRCVMPVTINDHFLVLFESQ